MTSPHTHRHDPDAIAPRPPLRPIDGRHPRQAVRGCTHIAAAAPHMEVHPDTDRGFWGALTRDERQAFAAYAEPVQLPVGHVLWREGDVADQVLVIQSGWVKISVRRGRYEHVIAVRGPGALIGERAAMQVRRRSATVVALATVHAMRLATTAFAAILAEHPRILRVVEAQMYDRLTEGGDSSVCFHGFPRTAAAASVPSPQDAHDASETPTDSAAATAGFVRATRTSAAPDAVTAPAPVADIRAGQNCTILYTDIVRFSGAHRTDDDRLVVRRVMYDLLRGALEESGVPWEPCHHEDRGDGALVIVPAEIPTRCVVDPMLALLTARLHRHNRDADKGTRFQLRVALHVGPVVPDEQGVSGLAIIQTARLLDAPVLKDWMDRTQADVGVIASTYVYEFVIAHAPGLVNPASYQRVTCKVKDAELTGWMHLSSAPI
ncbi:MAG: cyclic nucleotide-binding domain-containing protein, partial [Actinomadura rubrobrunea]|nr:cyclic nucleotide-binding domain-containing protein [Actinomadura rubrobrunea]